MDSNDSSASPEKNVAESALRQLSVVVPSFNESESIPGLIDRLDNVANMFGYTMQVILVDDGSTDNTEEVVSQLTPRHIDLLTYIKFRTNLGKSVALSEGVKRATSDIVITMDADLQDRPEEIPKLLTLIDDGYDVVSGWKKQRNDPVFGKKIPSVVFNWLVKKVLHSSLNDINCGLKAYRKIVWREIHVYGELHRFIPSLAENKGFKIGEIEVEHSPRLKGVSKYGASRFIKGILDLLTVYFLNSYKHRPLHFFGLFGGVIGLLGFLGALYLTILWFMGEPIGTRPLLQLSVLLLIISVQVILFGLLSQLQIELFHKSNNSGPNVSVVNFDYTKNP